MSPSRSLPASFLALALVAQGADPKPPAPPRQTPAAGEAHAARPAGLPAAMGEASEPKPYDKVVTADFKTQDGLLKVHQHKAKFLLEIPKAQLGRQLLLVATASQVPARVDHAGKEVAEEVIRFVQHENKIYLQAVAHAFVAEPGQAIAPAVEASQRETILASFNVEAFGKDGSAVIDATRLFTTEVGDFSARTLFNAMSLDGSRSYVDKVRAFKGSLRVDAVQTYIRSSQIPGMSPMPGMPMPPPQGATVLMAYSLVELPEKPMRARLHDDRVGFFTVGRVDYGSEAHESKVERLITRWRLEKKDPKAAVSEPVKPIVWYIDKATPAKWVPFIKKGVEAWNVAFEAAGFRNAVQARPFPTAEEDPEFDPDDVRYSVIRWVPSPVANAYGPHLSDPRSGEILNADIVLYHNILQLQRDWYLTQAGAVDPRARKLPLPDALMGDLLAYVVTHECGHSLGFPHNMKASSTYPVEKLRDPAWLKEMGHVSTLMDYSRFNYLVQPGDGVDPALLIPKIGPYDLFAVKWGYMPLDAPDPVAERPALDALAREQDAKPWLRFSTPRARGADYGENTEAVGDADAVKATGLGIANLKRILDMLPAAVNAPGESDDTLEHLYRSLVRQLTLEVNHVAVIVGGYETRNKHQGQEGASFTPVEAKRQREAVAFLGEQVFRTPTWLLSPAIDGRLTPSSATRALLEVQKSVLRTLLDRTRTVRLQEQEAQLGDKAYRLTDLLAGLRAGIFGELDAAAVKVAPHRRNLQRAYLELLDERLNRPVATVPAALAAFVQVIPPMADDTRGALRAELKALQSLAARKPGADKATRAHLEDLKDQIARILDPRLAPTGTSAPSIFMMGIQDEGCWPGLGAEGL